MNFITLCASECDVERGLNGEVHVATDAHSGYQGEITMTRRRSIKYLNEVTDLNLIPIMNLVLVLIPAVLFNTQLVKLGVIEMEAPIMGCCASPDRPLGLKIQLDPQQGFILTTRAEPIGMILGPENAKPDSAQVAQRHVIPKASDQSYDYKTLYRVATQLKNRYPRSNQVLLAGSAQVEFRDIVHTMDTIRHFTPEDRATLGVRHREMWDRVLFTTP